MGPRLRHYRWRHRNQGIGKLVDAVTVAVAVRRSVAGITKRIGIAVELIRIGNLVTVVELIRDAVEIEIGRDRRALLTTHQVR